MPATKPKRYTAPEALRVLFAIDSARHPAFRNAVNTLLKAKLPDKSLFFKPPEVEQLGYADDGRKRSYYSEQQLVQLHNAVLIHAIFSMPKQVIKFFDPKTTAERQELAAWVKELLITRQNAVGIGLLPTELHAFVAGLGSDLNLYEEKLPNPFQELPQLALDGRDSLLNALTTQLSVLSVDESMLIHYLKGDIEAAYQEAKQLPAHKSPLMKKYKALILKEYDELNSFDQFLDSLR